MTTTNSDRCQQLRIVPGRYLVEHQPADAAPPSGWVAQVRAPEGLTVIREVVDRDAETGEFWTALYGGESAHGLDLPGMLAALLEPLAEAAVPVFVASTFHADLVFVPEHAADRAVDALRAAGHTVTR